MAFRSDLDAIILGALVDGPLHGYAIVKRLHKHSDGLLKLGEGQLYPALHKLEKSNMVIAHWDQQEGKPSRRVYSLTEVGREELKRQQSAWQKFAKSINSVLKLG
jgi:PadR family transcriptional regulator, regulatory protein PadR